MVPHARTYVHSCTILCPFIMMTFLLSPTHAARRVNSNFIWVEMMMSLMFLFPWWQNARQEKEFQLFLLRHRVSCCCVRDWDFIANHSTVHNVLSVWPLRTESTVLYSSGANTKCTCACVCVCECVRIYFEINLKVKVIVCVCGASAMTVWCSRTAMRRAIIIAIVSFIFFKIAHPSRQHRSASTVLLYYDA